LRRAAFDGLALLNTKKNRDDLDATAGSERPIRVRLLAVVALAALDGERAAKAAATVLAKVPADIDPSEVFAAFLQRKGGPAQLAKALAGQKLPADAAKAGVRAVRASGRDMPGLIDALTKAGGLTAGLRKQLTKEEMRQTVADVLANGDPARGEAVYRRKDQACMKCHAIAGAGGQVGPDLASIGASAPVDYLIDSILQPGKAIKENYHALVVATKEGKVVTGVKVRETNADLILRDAEDREVAVPLKLIDARENGGSLMPDGLADALTRGELLDLVRFMSELGKVGPYSVGQARVVRRWQVLEPTAEARQVLLRAGFGAAAGDDPALTWSSAYSKVAGGLPLDAIPRVEVRKQLSKGTMPMGFVRCQVEATAAGPVKLRLNAAAGLTLWLDATPVPVQPETVVNLSSGLHTLTFAVQLDQRKDDLRCELDDVPGSAARARIVGGK
jgi:putative heme-binding domain-containing protein